MGLKVALIGAGAMGMPVLRALVAGDLPGALVVGVLTRTGIDGAESVAHFDSIDALLGGGPDIVVEMAGVEAFRSHVPRCLSAGCHVLAVSVAAMADPGTEQAVLRGAAKGGGRLIVASGATGALDAVSAAREAGLDSVTLIQRKPPSALMSEKDAARLDGPKLMMESSARDVALAFPRNSNIAAALALAGIGFDRTLVQVTADPAETHNVAEVLARGAFGELRLVQRNLPSPSSPRTAMLPAYSVIAALRRLTSVYVIPG